MAGEAVYDRADHHRARGGTSPTFSPVFDFGAVDQFRMDLGRGDMALGSGSEQRLGQDRQIRGCWGLFSLATRPADALIPGDLRRGSRRWLERSC